jgi:hypothetical protein
MKSKTENTIQNEVRDRLNASGIIRVFRNNTGQTPLPCPGCFIGLCGRCTKKYSRPVRYGLTTGSADLIGFTISGKFVSVELKTPKGKLEPDQIIWFELVKKWGGYAAVIRSVEEADEFIDEIRKGLSDK